MTNKAGFIISFSGIDGAGKSTQVELLSTYLKSSGKRVKTTEAMFGYFFLKPVVKILRAKTGSPPKGQVKRNKWSFAKLWFLPAFVDIWISHVFRYRPVFGKYDVVIADRFYTDIWANLLYYGYLPNWAFGVFVKLLPRADCALMLSVDPKNVLKREKDFPPAYYREQAKIYRRLGSKLNFCMVNANKDKKATFKQIIKCFEDNEDFE